ncbi:MAG: B12-binding domain-containing radical SAM protein [Candidatus Omnitrophica bacterium]|nr:B12-binding domain-containing radical SAM protein [Candidatus Omnitrophota bacterium]
MNNLALVLMPPFWAMMPPLGICTLRGFLSDHGIHADIFDLNNLQYRNKLSQEVRSNLYCKLAEYEILSFSCYKTNITETIETVKSIRTINPLIKIVLGGPEIASQYFKNSDKLTDIFKDFADLLVVGEGELPLLRFVSGYKYPNALALYDEIANANEFGYSMPDYSGLEIRDYPRDYAMSVYFSKGCVKKCKFCAEKLLYKKFTCLPVEPVIYFIEQNTNNGIRHFVFHDSLMNGNLTALNELVDHVFIKCPGIKWEGQIAIRNDMDIELLKKMKLSGACHLFVGLESGSDKVLNRMNKGYTRKDAFDFFEKLKQADLSFGVSIITGFPEETEEDFMDTVDFLVENKEIIRKIEQINPYVHYEGIDIPESYDYREREVSLKRAKKLIEIIKKEKIKHTNAYMLNLVEPEWK